MNNAARKRYLSGSVENWFSWTSRPEAWVALLTLTVLEIVLGIDNIIFISILAGKLPGEQQKKARQYGLMLALITRILLLLSVSYLASATRPLFMLPLPAPGAGATEAARLAFEETAGISVRDLILGLGGLFLIYKSVHEIRAKFEDDEHVKDVRTAATFAGTLGQIIVLDIVFSLDSVITAVGMSKDIPVMIIAVVVAVLFMLFASGAIAGFVEKHPTVKMLALSFLVLIGVNLIAEAAGQHIEKGYTYFAMAFAVGVEMLNIRLRPRLPSSKEPPAPQAEPPVPTSG